MSPLELVSSSLRFHGNAVLNPEGPEQGSDLKLALPGDERAMEGGIERHCARKRETKERGMGGRDGQREGMKQQNEGNLE